MAAFAVGYAVETCGKNGDEKLMRSAYPQAIPALIALGLVGCQTDSTESSDDLEEPTEELGQAEQQQTQNDAGWTAMATPWVGTSQRDWKIYFDDTPGSAPLHFACVQLPRLV